MMHSPLLIVNVNTVVKCVAPQKIDYLNIPLKNYF